MVAFDALPLRVSLSAGIGGAFARGVDVVAVSAASAVGAVLITGDAVLESRGAELALLETVLETEVVAVAVYLRLEVNGAIVFFEVSLAIDFLG